MYQATNNNLINYHYGGKHVWNTLTLLESLKLVEEGKRGGALVARKKECIERGDQNKKKIQLTLRNNKTVTI